MEGRTGLLMHDRNSEVEWLRLAVERFASPLTRYAASLTGDADRARDVVQDTFVRLCKQEAKSLNGRLAEWLFTVCRHRALDLCRKENRLIALTENAWEEAPANEATPAMNAERNDTKDEMLRLITTLPRNQQEVLRLKFQAGLRYEEISRVTNLSVSNVGFLLHTAIKTLREKMSK